MQKLLTLIIALAILYMIFQKNIQSIQPPEHLRLQEETGQQTKKEDSSAEMQGTFFERTLSSVLVNVLKTDEGRMFMESMLQPMNKSVAGSGSGFKMNNDSFVNSIFRISTFGDGEKGPASCGHVVTVHYKILNMNNAVLEEKTATYPLGSNKIAPGMDAVIVGMKTGQTRHATINSKYIPETAENKPNMFKLNVLLKDIVPNNFIGDDVKVFDDEIAYRIPLVCGNKAVYDAKVTRLSNGEVLYDSKQLGKKIDMQIGNLSYPVIFSHALHNKIPVGSRVVIAKGKLFKSYASDYSTIFKDKTLPADEYFMVEFSDFDDSIITQSTTFPHGKVE